MALVPTNNSNVAFFVRILPELNTVLDNVRLVDNGRDVYVRCWQDFAKGKDTQIPNYLLFSTNGIFYNTSQEEIFEQVAQDDLFEKLIYGNNGLILSYGQTGSGKTLTISGLQSTYDDRGILPRALEKLFSLKAEHSEKYKISIKMRCLETNRNNMVDLLSDDETIYDMNTYKHIKPTKVRSLYEAMKMLFKAEAKKTVRENYFYNSNIANTIVSISVFTKGPNTAVSEGTLHVVDLAGIDTIGNPSCAHKTGYEVGTGNLVKSQIEQLVLLINSNISKTAEIKRRLCISIYYLRNTMNNTSIIRVIAHIRVQRQDLKLCTSMLRLGCCFKGMVPKKLSRFLETRIDLQYQVISDELNALKKEMDLNSMLCNEDMSQNLTADRLEYIKQLTLEYLNSDQSELVLLSTTDSVTIMKVIKGIYQAVLDDHLGPTATASSRVVDGTIMPKRVSSEVSNASMDSKTKGIPSIMRRDNHSHTPVGVTMEKTSSHSYKSKRSNKKKLKPAMETSMQAIPTERRLSEAVPSFTQAWTMFKTDFRNKYTEIHDTQLIFETELDELMDTYNKEVLVLEELKNIATARKTDLEHAAVIRDIEVRPSTLDDLREFQDHCIKHAGIADRKVINQKEKLLRLQAEMRLNIQYYNKLQGKMNRIYDDYCMEKFGMLLPDVTIADKPNEIRASTSITDVPTTNEDLCVSSAVRYSNAISATSTRSSCKIMNQFERLQEFMVREKKRVARMRSANRRWMLSFQSGGCSSHV